MDSIVSLLVQLAIWLFVIVSVWIVFTKAGEPGWVSLIPLVNVYYLIKIAGKPWWWLILLFIPIIQLIPLFMVPIGVAKAFGKSALFGLGLLFLGVIFYPILAFGSAEYEG